MCNFLGSVAMHQLALCLGESWRCCGVALAGMCCWSASFYPVPTSKCWAPTTPCAFDIPQEGDGKRLLLG